MNKTLCLILAVIMALSCVSISAHEMKNDINVISNESTDFYRIDKIKNLVDKNKKIPTDDELVHVMVRLDPSYFSEFGQMEDASNLYTDEGIKRQIDFGKRAVNEAVSILKKSEINFDVLNEFNVLLVGFDTKVSFLDAKKIASFDFVKSVSLQKTINKPTTISPDDSDTSFRTFQSRDIIGNEKVYSKYKGEGTIIAVIDSGFDVDHEAFYLTDVGRRNKVYSKEDIDKLKNDNILDHGMYINEKIPFAYNYFPSTNPEKIKQNSLNSHGQHVAGTIGGNRVIAKLGGLERELIGVAPEAQLALMRVFSDDTPGTDPSIYVKALEDCVKLKVTAVNMSLGSAAGDSNQIDENTTDAINRLEEAGCVVAVAAGNETAFGNGQGLSARADNPDYGILGNPAAAEKSLAVASIENGFTVQEYLTNVDKNGVEHDLSLKWSVDVSNNNFMTDPEYDKEYELVDVGLGKKEDYDNLNVDLNGKVALIKRGESTFENKVVLAKEHGAAAAIIYNHEKGGDQFVGMKNTWNKGIPVASVFYSTGVKLKENGGKVIFRDGKMEFTNPLAGDISEFSSFGLSSDGSFKPDITGPGGNILSLGNNNTYNVQSGTSMATPHVAGGLALAHSMVNDRFPNLSEKEKWQRIRNLIMSTAEIHYNQLDAATSPRRQGAGVMKLQNALSTKAILLGDKGETKLIKRAATNNETLNFKLQNLSNDKLHYKYKAILVADEVNKGYFTYETRKLKDVDLGEIDINPNETKDISVNINTEEFKDELKSEMPNGYFVDGFIEFLSDDEPTISIPFITFVGDLDKLNFVEPSVYDLDKLNLRPYYWNEKGNTHIGGFNNSDVPNSDFTHLYTYIGEKSEILGQDKDFTNENPKFYEKRVISPNKDGFSDAVTANFTMLRSAYVSAYVYKLDESGIKSGEPIATLKDEEYLIKNFGASMMPLSYSIGKSFPDSKTTLEDGEYVLTIKAHNVRDKEAVETDMPFTVDTKKPEIKNLKVEGNILNFDAVDENGLREVVVKYNDDVIEKTFDGYHLPEGANLNNVTIEAVDLGYNKYKTTVKMALDGNGSSVAINAILNKEDNDFKLNYKIYDKENREFYEDNLSPGEYTLKIKKPDEIYNILDIDGVKIEDVKFEDGIYIYNFAVNENEKKVININIEKLDASYVFFWIHENHQGFKGVKLVNKDNKKEIVLENTMGSDSPTYFGPKVYENLVPYGKYKIVFDADKDNYEYKLLREKVKANGINEKIEANYDLVIDENSPLNNAGNISYTIESRKKSVLLNVVGENHDKAQFKLVKEGTDRNFKFVNVIPSVDLVKDTSVDPKDYMIAPIPEDGYYAEPAIVSLELGKGSITNYPSKTSYEVQKGNLNVTVDIKKSNGFGSLKVEDNSENLGYKQEYILEDMKSYFGLGGKKYKTFDKLPEGTYILRPVFDENSKYVTNDTFKLVKIKANEESNENFVFKSASEEDATTMIITGANDNLNIKIKSLKTGEVIEPPFKMSEEGKINYFFMAPGGIYELIVEGENVDSYDYPKYFMMLNDKTFEIKKKNADSEIEDKREDEELLKALDELKKLIEEAKSKDESIYTEKSIAALKEAISQVDKDYNDVFKVREAIKTLKTFMDNLSKKPVEVKKDDEVKPFVPPIEPDYEFEFVKNEKKSVDDKSNKSDKKENKSEPKKEKKDYGIILNDKNPTVKFVDVSEFRKDVIDFVNKYGIMKGISSDEFGPDYSITRAMVVETLMRISKDKSIKEVPRFSDIKKNDWYNDSVYWATSHKIVNGYEDKTFKPNQLLRRQEFALILDRFLTLRGINLEKINDLSLNSSEKIPAWSIGAVKKMINNGLVLGYEKVNYKPDSYVSRYELAKALKIIVEWIIKENN